MLELVNKNVIKYRVISWLETKTNWTKLTVTQQNTNWIKLIVSLQNNFCIKLKYKAMLCTIHSCISSKRLLNATFLSLQPKLNKQQYCT